MSAEKRPSSLYLDLKNLRELFQEVDKDEKGYIDFDGLQEMISNMEEFDPNMAKELMEKLDRDKDGKVSDEILADINIPAPPITPHFPLYSFIGNF